MTTNPQQPGEGETAAEKAAEKIADAKLLDDDKKAVAVEKLEERKAEAIVKAEDKKIGERAIALTEKYKFLTNILVVLLTALGPVLTSFVLYYQSQTHRLVNSMKDELVREVKKTSHAEGVEEGKASREK